MPIDSRNVYETHPAGPELRKLPLCREPEHRKLPPGREVRRSELETRVMTRGKPDTLAHIHPPAEFITSSQKENSKPGRLIKRGLFVTPKMHGH